MTTTVTVELTDEMVAALRIWQREPIPPGVSSFHIPTVVSTLVANELPPLPERVNIELPAGLAAELRKTNRTVPPDRAVDLWRIIERALAGGGA